MEDCKSISECPAIDELVESSKTLDNDEESVNEYYPHLKWIPYRELTDIRSCQSSIKQTAYYATYMLEEAEAVMLLLLGTVEECTQELIHEFARTHSLPTHKYNNPPNINQFKRYATWLKRRNELIE